MKFWVAVNIVAAIVYAAFAVGIFFFGAQPSRFFTGCVNYTCCYVFYKLGYTRE